MSSYSKRNHYRGPRIRVNERIRAREVRVVGHDGKQIGVMAVNEAIRLAKQHGVDLVEIAPTAKPPVCRVVDFGKYQYELSKKQKEQKKHQHSNKLKEIQLSPVIDPHDYSYKLDRAKQFLSEDMKVKLSLRFKGRQMAHTEVGFDVVHRFIQDIAAFAQPDSKPKLVGRSINMVLSPLPKNKRAKFEGKHVQDKDGEFDPKDHDADHDHEDDHEESPVAKPAETKKPAKQKTKSSLAFLSSVLDEYELEDLRKEETESSKSEGGSES